MPYDLIGSVSQCEGVDVVDSTVGGQTLPDPKALSAQPIGSHLAKGVIWAFGQLAASRVIQFASQIALAWLLSSKDFGIIGLTFTLTGTVSALFSFGLEDVLLQRQNRLRLWISDGFWLSMLSGCLAAMVVVAISPAAAAVYHTPQVIPLAAVIALSMPFAALSTVPSAVVRARLSFRLVASIAAAETLMIQSLTITFAALGMGAYSFVIPLPIVALARALALWHFASPIAITSPKLKKWKFLVGNASAVMGVNFITSLVHQGDYIVLGALYPNSVVGLYYFSYKIAVQPLQLLAGSLSNLLFPTLSKFQRDSARQYSSALKACDAIALIVTPACFLQAGLSEPFLRLLFPDRWLQAAPILQILSVGLAFDAVSWAAGPLLHARGEFKRSLLYSLITAPMFFGLVCIGAFYGSAMGVAMAVGIFYALVGPAYTYLVFRPGGIRPVQIAAIYITPTLLSGAIVLAAVLAAERISTLPIARALIILGLTIPTYLSAIRYLRPTTCRELVARISKLFVVKGVALRARAPE
jgi:O-antigen/teichoic acid export membrane protein